MSSLILADAQRQLSEHFTEEELLVLKRYFRVVARKWEGFRANYQPSSATLTRIEKAAIAALVRTAQTDPAVRAEVLLGATQSSRDSAAPGYGSAGSYSSGSGPGVAENGSYYGEISPATGRPKTVHVGGYYRKDGTYVRGHYRSSPGR